MRRVQRWARLNLGDWVVGPIASPIFHGLFTLAPGVAAWFAVAPWAGVAVSAGVAAAYTVRETRQKRFSIPDVLPPWAVFVALFILAAGA